MKLFIAVCAGVLMFNTFANGQRSPIGNDAEFAKLIDGYNTAWSTMNPDNAARFYAKDAKLVFYDIAPLKYIGWSDYEKGARAMFSGFESLKLTGKGDLSVTRRGNIAWTTTTFHLSVKPKSGAPMELDGRHTVIWEKRGARWLIVHEHFSAPLPG